MDKIDHTNVIVPHVKVTTWINFDDINQTDFLHDIDHKGKNKTYG
jgi:hypothetical protein